VGGTVSQQTARYLRKHQTDAERKLWRELRNLKREGFHFRRQAPIGRYVADFACHSAKLVVEVDGSQHNEDGGLEADAHRTTWLETRGYRVVGSGIATSFSISTVSI
jgi:very-short-patch-repair endonuclease